MTNPSNSAVQNLLPVQAYFNLDGSFNTFIGQGTPFYATANPIQSGLTITNSTLDSSPIGSTSPSTGVFTNIATTTGTISTQPTGANDIVNLLALQSYAAGISWKQPCAVGTLVNITLSGLQTIDGYTTLAGDRVLVKNQSTAANNGIYLASATAWTRALDANTWDELVSAISFMEYGTQAGSAWYCTAQPGGTLGVTAVNWSQFTTSANYTAGTGLTLAGYQFSITPQGTAGTYGSASQVPVFVTNASGQVTSVTNTSIAITNSQVSGLGTMSTQNANAVAITGGSINGTTIGASTASTGLFTTIGGTTITASTQFTGPGTGLTGTATGLSIGGSSGSATTAGSVTNSVTFNNAGAGGASGSTFNGATALTVSYNTIGAPSTTGTNASGTWGISVTGNAGTVTDGVYTSGSYANPTWITSILGSIVSGAVATATAATNISGGLAGSLPYQSGASATTFLGIGSANYVLTSSGTAPQYVAQSTLAVGSATTATTATNLAGGIASQIPYQTAAGTTAFIANGTTGQFLVSNGTSAPSWSSVTTAVTISDQTASASTFYPSFVSATSGTTNTINTSSTKLQYVPSTGVFTATEFSGSGASLTSLTAGNLSGTIPSGVLGNSTVYIGTTAVALNRASASISLTGTSIDGSAGSATTATTATNATNTAITDNTSSSATWYPTIVSATTGNLPQTTSSTKLSFVPSTGVLTATAFGGNATSATNIASGSANQIPYQTGASATSFITAPTTASTYLQWNGSAFAWAAVGAGAIYDTPTTSTGYFAMSSGTTAQRPSSPANGYTRFNTTLIALEVYSATNGWEVLTTYSAVPGAPTIGTATVVSSTSVSVSYTAPSFTGGTITSYTAVASPGGQTGTVAQSGSGSITVTGLTPNTAYTFTVFATSAAGSSASSSASNSVTTWTVPNAPTIGTATATGATTATVSYTAPGFNGNTAITSYTAVSSPGNITGTLSQAGSGTITVSGLTANTSYTFTVYATNAVGNSASSSASNSITTPRANYSASYLIVGGGGGGGTASFNVDNGGGGGAGGLLSGSLTVTPNTVYSFTVGGGGGVNSVGSNSVAFSNTANGGGGGANGNGTAASSGGSGGGGSGINNTTGASGTSGQGNKGGNGSGSWGAGGGGASAVGGNGATGGPAGSGGAGSASSITGSSITYAGGGGGSGGNTSYPNGGSGGGGTGNGSGGNGTAGTTNLGGGGGAGSGSGGAGTGGSGGSGVVIISVPTADYNPVYTGSPIITTSGSNTILKFTASGSYTA